MATYTDYFENSRPKPVWHIGDRVFGYWNKIPFIGTVANDHIVNEEKGPVVHIFLDLPIQHDDRVFTIITVGQSDIQRLKTY